ncbi:MAG: SMC family ATPase [Thermoplasmata archaeon]|nr:SMC family ATPase [Thermoplasmata archaeon]
MRIKKIVLENIRSYVHEEIEFGKGLSFFEGDIGAGKSTILMAVKFALFGKSRGLEYLQLLREGAREGSVRLTFLVDGKEYIISRVLRRKTPRKKGEVVEVIEQEKVVIEDENTKQELAPRDADERILKILGAGRRLRKQTFSKMYEYALYVPQEEMKAILADLKQDREAKRKTISHLFGCEVYGVARENANVVRKAMEKEIELAMAKLGENCVEIDKKEQELAQERKELEQKGAEASRIEEEIAELNRKVTELKVQVETFEKLRKEREGLEGKKRELRVKKEQISKEIGRHKEEIAGCLGEIETKKGRQEELKPHYENFVCLSKRVEEGRMKKKKVEKIEEQINKKQGSAEEIRKQITELEERIKGADEIRRKLESFGDLEKDLEVLEQEKAENTEKISVLRTEIEGLKKEIGESEKEKAEMTGLAGLQVCPKCRQPLTKDHIDRMRREIEEKVVEKTKAIKENEAIASRIKARQVFVENQIKEKRKILKEKEKLQHSLEEIERKRAEMAEAKKRVAAIEAEIEHLKKEVAATGFDRQQFAEIERQHQELKPFDEEWKGLTAEIREKEKQLEILSKKLGEYEKDYQDVCTELEAVEAKLEEIVYDEHEDKKTRENFTEISKELAAKKEGVARIMEQMKEKKKRIGEIEKELEELRRIKERMEKCRGYVEWFEKLAKCYEEIEKNVLREARYLLEEELRALFNELMENAEMDITLDENFTPEISVGDGYIRPFENLSGGEGTALALAYRLALNRVITRSFFGENALLILDEPTDGFSSEQINSLRELLGRIKENYADGQIFVVSHEQELEGVADVVYEVTQTGNGTKVKMRGADANI